MVDKKEVISFFDSLADKWDAGMEKNDIIINRILDNAGVSKGSRVLDVACGTGVLIPYYLLRGVASVTAIDISPEMIKTAKSKFNESNVDFICADAEEFSSDEKYDNIVIYNAFPHFSSPDKLISNLSSLLASGGTITVAHGMSRDRINMHHSGISNNLCCDLMTIEELSELFRKYMNPTIMVSDDLMYQVVGRKN